jgi:hypothetical protein
MCTKIHRKMNFFVLYYVHYVCQKEKSNIASFFIDVAFI